VPKIIKLQERNKKKLTYKLNVRSQSESIKMVVTVAHTYKVTLTRFLRRLVV